jgi:tetratricopeptide (TPR) repeat protein
VPDERETVYLPQSVMDAVALLANAFSWDEQRQVIEEHPASLLGEYADTALSALLQQYEGQPHVTLVIEELSRLLRDCRDLGVGEAFARRRRLGRAGIRPEVLQALGTMTEDQMVGFLIRSPGVQEPFLDASTALINASTAGAKRAVLLREQDLLLHPAAETLFRSTFNAVPGMESYADLLALARDEGIDTAIAQTFGGDTRVPQGDSAEVDEILHEFAFAEQYLNPERRIELSRRGLTLVEPATPRWAALQSFLCMALVRTYNADRGERIEEAIAGFGSVAAWAEDNGLPGAASMAHEMLSRAYCERVYGVQAANVEQAVQEAELAIGFAATPAESRSSRYAAAMAYRVRLSGDRAGNLRRGYDHARAALEIADPDSRPEVVAALHHALGLIASSGGPDDHGDRGLTYLRQASEDIDANEDPDNWVRARIDLGERLTAASVGDIEEGITVLQAALTLASPQNQPERWANVHSVLAHAYRRRVNGDLSGNLEEAVHHAEQALTVYTRADFPDSWAVALERLADALRLRLHGNPEINAEAAITHYQSLADYYSELGDRRNWAGIQMDLGLTYANGNRVNRGEPGKAVISYELALEEYQRLGDAEHAAKAHANLLGLTPELLRRGLADGDFVASVIGRSEEALSSYYTRESAPDDYMKMNISLGDLNRELGSNDPDRLAAAARYLEEGIAAATPSTALDAFEARDTLAHVRFKLDDVDAAAECLTLLIGEGEQLLAKTVTEESKRRVLADLASGYTDASYLELQRGHWTEALRLLERGQSRLLLDVLEEGVDLASLEPGVRSRIERARNRVEETRNALNAISDRDPAQLSRALGVARAELAEALAGINGGGGGSVPGIDPWQLLPTDGGVLVAPVVTWMGVALFVLPSAVNDISEQHVLKLDCTHDDLARAERDWMVGALDTASGKESFSHWTEIIEQVTGWLWTAVAGPLRERLVTLGVADGTPLRFTSSEFTSKLPLHAAWRIEDGVKRTLLDDHVVSYTPGIRMLYEARRRASQPRRQAGTQSTALLVADSIGDLPHAVEEVRAIAEIFPADSAKTLIGPDATSSAVFAGVAGRSYVHFACHAFANWFQPNHSSVVLANGELVVAGELANLDLKAARLAVLSACESGTEVSRSASDYTGIAAALLRAGVPSVIATLWSVDDHASSLLMRRFYEELLGGGQPPAMALRHAQLWLRNATLEELGSRDPSLASDRRSRLLGIDPHDRPYESPFFWAGYFLIGA